MWRRGSASASAARSPTRWAMPTCNASSTASSCRARSTCRRTLPHRSRSKKDRTAAARGRHGVPPRHGGAVGDGRASHRPQAAPPPHLGADWAAAHRAGPASLRLALSRRLRASGVWSHALSSGDQREHPALRGRTRRLCPPGRSRAQQADRPWSSTARAGMPHSACACPTTSTCSSCRRTRLNSSQPSISGRSPTRRSINRHFTEHRGARRGATRPLRRAPTPARAHSLHDAVPLVAAPPQTTTGTQTKLI